MNERVYERMKKKGRGRKNEGMTVNKSINREK